jgi:hypothetical protein
VKIDLTPEEAVAICEFYSYGATRGNHAGPDGTGPVPGPLTGHINAMGAAVVKVWAARNAEPAA